jgi:hypothetical protein
MITPTIRDSRKLAERLYYTPIVLAWNNEILAWKPLFRVLKQVRTGSVFLT